MPTTTALLCRSRTLLAGFAAGGLFDEQSGVFRPIGCRDAMLANRLPEHLAQRIEIEGRKPLATRYCSVHRHFRPESKKKHICFYMIGALDLSRLKTVPALTSFGCNWRPCVTYRQSLPGVPFSRARLLNRIRAFERRRTGGEPASFPGRKDAGQVATCCNHQRRMQADTTINDR
ncbi:MAG: hypothetical protein E5W60_10910 [Mesorhizobium sp.]|nr:MAG: hypothetical protein E5W60_10910 [Mesorhizobium sp.]